MKNNMSTEVKLCKSCVRNINSKYVPSSNGECGYCQKFHEYEKNLKGRLKKIKGNFSKELIGIKGKGDYDCLVMVSGGKDSIMALYKIKKETKLRLLAYTIDNGFEPVQAIENIKNAVEKLEIDWIFDKPAYMLKTIKAILQEKVEISLCRFCACMIVNRAVNIAHSLQIPCIITGWSKGQSDKEPSRFPLWNISEEKIDELVKKYPFMKRIGLYKDEKEKLMSKYGIKVISPWIFEKRDNVRNMKILVSELGWKKTVYSYPRNSTSCYLNLLQVILSRKYFGYTHYDCEESMLVGYEEKTRKQAISTNNMDINITLVNQVLKKLELKPKDIGLSVADIKKYSKFYY